MNLLKRSIGGVMMSVVELLVGILLLVDPAAFTSGIIAVFGVVLMVMGVGNVIKYFRAEPEEAAVSQSFVKGLVELLAGAFCAFNASWFLATFPVLTLLYGVVILFTGLTKLQWMVDSIRLKRRRWFFAGISAAVSVICGIIIISSPFSTTAVLWMFIGISLIIEAVCGVIAAVFGNKAQKSADPQEAN